jgi:hypothetical protein
MTARLPDLIANCLKSPKDLAQLLQRRGLIHSAAFEDPEHYDSGKTMHAVMQLLADIQEAAAPSTPAGKDALARLKTIAEMPDYDQDDAHRLRNIARHFFIENPAAEAHATEHPVNRGAFWERTKENPREKALAEAWERENEPRPFSNYGQGVLQDLFSKPGRFGHIFPQRTLNITNRDRMIAATVIQWIGSTCGFSMLMEAIGKCGLRVVTNEGYEEMSKDRRRLKELAENLEIALTPSRWNRETHNAWNSAIPDTDLAFAHLRQFAFQQTERTVTAIIHAERQKPAAELPALLEEPWPMRDILAKLSEAADILLNERAYDGHGWEEIATCRDRAKIVLDMVAPASPACILCGEKLEGTPGLSTSFCGLCADDELNATNP